MQGQCNEGKLSLQEQTRLSRMIAEQEAIRSAMNDLYENMSNRGDILGRMDKITEDIINNTLANW